jgi:hypothetical protein
MRSVKSVKNVYEFAILPERTPQVMLIERETVTIAVMPMFGLSLQHSLTISISF